MEIPRGEPARSLQEVDEKTFEMAVEPLALANTCELDLGADLSRPTGLDRGVGEDLRLGLKLELVVRVRHRKRDIGGVRLPAVRQNLASTPSELPAVAGEPPTLRLDDPAYDGAGLSES